MGIFGSFGSRPEKKNLSKKEETKINPFEIVNNKEEREKIKDALETIQRIIKTLKDNEKGEWEVFFRGCGFSSISEVKQVLESFSNILASEKINPIAVLRQSVNIKKVSSNLDRIREWLKKKKDVDILEAA